MTPSSHWCGAKLRVWQSVDLMRPGLDFLLLVRDDLLPAPAEKDLVIFMIDVVKSAELEGKGVGLSPDPHPWLTA